MELMGDLVNNQLTLYIPVALVLVGAVLVFAFGFKSAEQPPFDKLSSVASDDKKSTNKKRKVKDKRAANGTATFVTENSKGDRSKDKEQKRSPAKETPNTPKQQKRQESSPKPTEKKKQESQKPKKVESVEEIKNKKNKAKIEKPADYDDGNWETVPSKNDKKKKQDSPAKKDKKVTSKNKPPDVKDMEIEKLIKEEVEKQLQEDNKENKATENINKPMQQEDTVPVIEEKKEKLKKEKKPKKVVQEIIEPPSAPAPPREAPAPVNAKEEEPVSKQTSGGIAFDELGDIWTEAKAVKKSKKKSRRDN